MAVPETVRDDDGESTERVPVVLTVTPVKVLVISILMVIGVTAIVTRTLRDCDPPVVVTLKV